MCRHCVSTVFTHPSLWSTSSFTTDVRHDLMAEAEKDVDALRPGHAQAQATTGADIIFRGGTIIPMASSGPKRVEALAVRGSQIIAVGAESDLAGLKTASTKIVDLGGRTMLPGLIDPHNHVCISALFATLATDVGFMKNRTHADVLADMKALEAKLPPNEWLRVYNYDNMLQGGDLSMADLESVSKDRPIFVWYTNGHVAAVNSAGLKAAQIPDDIGPLVGNGRFGRGPDGKFTGLVYEENAILMVVAHAMPKITLQVFEPAVVNYLKMNAALGVTTMHEPGTVLAAWVDSLVKLTASGTSRLSASFMYDHQQGSDAFNIRGDGKATLFPNSRFSLYGIKIVGDGANQTRTGGQTIPYLGTNDKGAPNFSPEELKTNVAAVKAEGRPIQIHCNGDATIDEALDAIEAAYGANPPTGINRIEHSTMARLDQLKRMKALGVEPSFLINHLYFYGAAYRDHIFGPERAAFMDPAGACVSEGLPFTLHTDSPCSPLGPLGLIEVAVTRQCVVDNSIIGPDQAISVEEAIRAVTSAAAKQIGQGDRLGTLEVNKEADLVILEQNPFDVAPYQIRNIKVSQTWVGGEKIFG